MGQNPPHAYTIGVLTAWLVAIFPWRCVRPRTPIEACPEDSATSLPEPDFAVIAGNNPEHEICHIRGDEVLLAIEVADASISQDLGRKRDLYARAGSSSMKTRVRPRSEFRIGFSGSFQPSL